MNVIIIKQIALDLDELLHEDGMQSQGWEAEMQVGCGDKGLSRGTALVAPFLPAQTHSLASLLCISRSFSA